MASSATGTGPLSDMNATVSIIISAASNLLSFIIAPAASSIFITTKIEPQSAS